MAAPTSLIWATDIEVLPIDRLVQRRDGYLLVRSPSNPAHYWGNFLLFDEPPAPGDGARWEALFDREFANQSASRHRAFGWAPIDGALGAARTEFCARGYELQQTVGLIAGSGALRPQPRENRDVIVRALDPAPGADHELWEQVLEVQAASRDPRFDEDEDAYRAFSHRRLSDLRAVFLAGRGAWWVALEPEGGQVVGSLGLVVTDDRGRYQTVDTAQAHRRRGICSRLVVEAARRTAERHGTRQFVIGADPDYHALGLYESLGFARRERVAGVYRRPDPSA